MIVANIRKLCTEHDISIHQLEKACNIGNGVIARWETSSPTLGNVEKVAEYFKISVDKLIKGGGADEQRNEP